MNDLHGGSRLAHALVDSSCRNKYYARCVIASECLGLWALALDRLGNGSFEGVEFSSPSLRRVDGGIVAVA
jgi:hypothetical protein